MKAVIRYVLQDKKVTEGYVMITGPYSPETISVNGVYNAFLEEKQLWGKDSGRMFAHNVTSFHKDEKTYPAECLEIGKQFCEKFFPNHQNLIAVHQDRDHLHVHIVTNTVSFMDGRKLHQTKYDLQRQKDFTNELCRSRGLSVTEKGKHFDGTDIEPGEIHAWNQDKYRLLTNQEQESYVIDCATAIVETVPECATKDDFVIRMKERGWIVCWSKSNKHIIFQNRKGHSLRDINLAKTFSINLGLEGFLYELERAYNASSYDGGAEEYFIRSAAELVELFAKYIFSALRDTVAFINDAGIAKKTGSVRAGQAEKGRGNTDAERQKFDAFLAEFKAFADAGRASTEHTVREADATIDNSRAERGISERKTAETESRDAESKACERERRPEEQSGTIHKKTRGITLE